jgi:hypothetical protein
MPASSRAMTIRRPARSNHCTQHSTHAWRRPGAQGARHRRQRWSPWRTLAHADLKDLRDRAILLLGLAGTEGAGHTKRNPARSPVW